MDFEAVAEGVVEKETSPGGGATGIDDDTSRFEFLFQLIDAGYFQPEMALFIRARLHLDSGEMQVNATDIEPNAATGAERFGLGDFRQAKQRAVEVSRSLFAASGNGQVGVGETHRLLSLLIGCRGRGQRYLYLP